jgi:hypothetical protein
LANSSLYTSQSLISICATPTKSPPPLSLDNPEIPTKDEKESSQTNGHRTVYSTLHQSSKRKSTQLQGSLDFQVLRLPPSLSNVLVCVCSHFVLIHFVSSYTTFNVRYLLGGHHTCLLVRWFAHHYESLQ